MDTQAVLEAEEFIVGKLKELLREGFSYYDQQYQLDELEEDLFIELVINSENLDYATAKISELGRALGREKKAIRHKLSKLEKKGVLKKMEQKDGVNVYELVPLKEWGYG